MSRPRVILVWRVFCGHFERPGLSKQRKFGKTQNLSSVRMFPFNKAGREDFGEVCITFQHIEIGK